MMNKIKIVDVSISRMSSNLIECESLVEPNGAIPHSVPDAAPAIDETNESSQLVPSQFLQ